MLTFDQAFRKDRTHPIGFGYDNRPAGTRPSAIIIHTTNGKPGSTFAGEAKFLRDSGDVSAHYLVGKEGQLAEILPPELRAFHAGVAINGFGNSTTIGIECHHAKEDDWPSLQRDTLTRLVRQLMAEFDIHPTMIRTHRAIALPPGRKEDPSDWSDAEFSAWRETLAQPPELRRFQVVVESANVREGPGVRFAIAMGGQAVMLFGHTFDADQIVEGERVGPSSEWIHRADDLGFMHSSVVEPL